MNLKNKVNGKRIGIIGLDTSHSTAFVEALNSPNPDAAYDGYKIVAAYPNGSKTIKSSYERIPAYTEQVKKLGVEIVSSIKELLTKVDVVMLETNDGRPHLEQALEVMKAVKTLWIDKPVAGTLVDAIAIFDASKKYKVPVFSASSLRYATNVQETANGTSAGKILGADTFSPCPLEATHPDFFWYGIHGIEILLTVMGTGCKQVSRVHTEDTDVVTGVWKDNRIGTFRGNRKGPNEYGGTAFGEKAVVHLGPYAGYEPLLKEIVKFFNTGIAPVSVDETLEIYAFMEAADESKRRGGIAVTLDAVMKKALSKKKIIH
ncbi:MAG: oxidoreductase protein [Ferruginibacter sp.]|uniref:Gfo/Idh/MocA family protein n=1 Tax=Ferruginibacter sp. TaxID=1940288 RepID=UPI0026585066|nr:Gfo/Idh/MocA family oxidoreductase [Ferruginibacter sp.]MDB5278810.1 oxidoreductase protein [Ferruginibacter sp.]